MSADRGKNRETGWKVCAKLWHAKSHYLPAALILLALAACSSAPSPPALSPHATHDSLRSNVTQANFSDRQPPPWDGRAPETYPVHGIDTSRWQSDIDWRTARANGVNFAFIKATEGGDILDPAFTKNWHAARAAGVPVGAYHFWYHCRPAAEQARWFISHVPKTPGALPPVLDMEWTPFSPTCTLRPAPDKIRAEAKVFLDLLEAHYGQRPIIYSAPDFFEQNEMWRLGDYAFWLRSVAGHPRDIYAGRHWTFWQYTGTGRVPGISGDTDINVFSGSREEWAHWLARHSR